MHTRSSSPYPSSARSARALAEVGGVEAGDVAGEVEVPLGPVADHRQLGAEALGDDVLGVADEQREIAHVRMVRDVLHHVGVVVGGEEALAFVALVHRQEADEVRHPGERHALLARVLVQVVVELPRLVPDPQVVALLAHDVVEDHEVRREDLVHAAQRLEAVQIVLGRLRLDVARLVREVRARRVDALALRFEHARHRVLGEPVDLEVGLQATQLTRDRDVALRVPEPDRRGDEECSRAPVGAVDRGIARRPRPARGVVEEISQREVHLHRPAGVREVAAAADALEASAGEPRERASVARRRDRVAVAVHDEHRAAQPLRELAAAAARSRMFPPRIVAMSVSGSVSSAHPTPSSTPFVECGSEKQREMNHCAKAP